MHKPLDGCQVFRNLHCAQPLAQPMITPSCDVMRCVNRPKTAVNVEHDHFRDLQLQRLHRWSRDHRHLAKGRTYRHLVLIVSSLTAGAKTSLCYHGYLKAFLSIYNLLLIYFIDFETFFYVAGGPLLFLSSWADASFQLWPISDCFIRYEVSHELTRR